MKRLLIRLVFSGFIVGSMLISGGCANEDLALNEREFYSDTLPSQFIHDIIFNSYNEMYILGSSVDDEAQIPQWSSFIPFKMQLIKYENQRYFVYDRIPKTIMIRFDKTDNLLALTTKNLLVFRNGEMKVYAEPEIPENASFGSLVIDDKNQLWVAGFNTGIHMYDGEQWKNFTTENSDLPENNIIQMSTNGKTVWALTETQDGIVTIQNKQLQYFPFNSEIINSINYFFMESGFDDQLLLIGQNDIYIVENSWDEVTQSPVFSEIIPAEGTITIRNVKSDNEGNIYILYSFANNTERYIIRLDQDLNIKNVALPADYQNTIIFTMSFDTGNNLWLGTQDGIVKIPVEK